MIEPKTATRVERGMVLLVREEREGLPTKHTIWTVVSARHGKKSAAVKLVAYTAGILMEATATFPDGEIREPWKLVEFSQRDRAFLWEKLP